MIVSKITTRNIGFSRFPGTLKRNLVTNASTFDDFSTRTEGWFGPAVCTLVEVEDENGVVGVGTAGAFHGGAKQIIDDYYVPLLLGQEIQRHEHLWQRMYRTTVRFGRSGSAMCGISALDIALWDLHGKVEGKPVYDLIGGRTQSSAPCYVSRLYAFEDLDELREEARGWLKQGFTRMKQRFGFGPKDGPAGMLKNVALVQAVREVVGDGVELAADAYMGWDVGYAIEMAKLLRDFNLSWIEEPLMPHEVDGYVELKHRCPWQRWSCGEHCYGKWEFRDLLRRRAVDILQPDVNRAGGITEVIKISAMAEAEGMPVVPHSNEAHNLHIVFSRSAHVCPVVEYFPNVEPDTGNELFWKLYQGLPTAERGNITMTDAPGLGLTLRMGAVNQLQIGDVTVHAGGKEEKYAGK
jgi:L-alanine-DL-glutamate epimerase-like enolase superfamily enzyme